jgi:hypothetical protein
VRTNKGRYTAAFDILLLEELNDWSCI